MGHLGQISNVSQCRLRGLRMWVLLEQGLDSSALGSLIDSWPLWQENPYQLKLHQSLFEINGELSEHFNYVATSWKVRPILLKWRLKKPQGISITTSDERWLFSGMLFRTRGFFSHFFFLLSYFSLLWLFLCVIRRGCCVSLSQMGHFFTVWPLEKRRLYYPGIEAELFARSQKL